MISSLVKRAIGALIPTSSNYANTLATPAAMVLNGSFNISHRTIQDKLVVNGEAKLGEETIVQNTITVNGTFHAVGTTFQSALTANGPSTLKQSKILDTAHFSGIVTATSSQFFKDLTLRTHKSIFSNCQLSAVTVQEIPNETKQVIHLKNGSLITGDVTFQSNRGEVVIDESSQLQGNVYGGTRITY